MIVTARTGVKAVARSIAKVNARRAARLDRGQFGPGLINRPLGVDLDQRDIRRSLRACRRHRRKRSNMAQTIPPDEIEGGGNVPPEIVREIPKGAFALALITALLLIAAWLAVYFFLFVPR